MMEAALSGVHPDDSFTPYGGGFTLKTVPVELYNEGILRSHSMANIRPDARSLE